MTSTKQLINPRDFWRVPLGLIGLFGLQLFTWDENDKPKTFNKIRFFLMVFVMLPFSTFSMLGFVVGGNLETALDRIAFGCYIGFTVNGTAKLYTLFLGRQQLGNVIKRMEQIFPQTETMQRTYKVAEYYKYINKCNWFLAIYTLTITSLFNVFPLLQSVTELYGGTKQFGYHFPYMFAFPFDERRPVGYIIAYIVECLGGYMASCYCVGPDLLLITAVHMINMNFNYLSNAIVEYQTHGNIDEDIAHLRSMLIYQKQIIEFCNEINDVFSISVLLNYLLSGFLICLIAFQVVVGSDSLSLIKFMGFLFETLMLVFVISLFGSRLCASSQGINDAFYKSCWYKCNVKYQRLLPLILARSQRPAYLTAYKFFIVSMETFQTVLTTSYQFFTLIKARFVDDTL